MGTVHLINNRSTPGVAADADDIGIAMVRVPVRCPRCGVESLDAFPEIVVVAALARWNNMQLHASCHAASWSASRSELARIRDYVGIDWLETRRSLLATTS